MKALPANLLWMSDGSLWNYRRKRTVRERYAMHTTHIHNTLDVRACLRAGKSTSLGGYALAFVMADGDTLCFDCVRNDYREVSEALRSQFRYPSNGWRPLALAVECDSDSECICGQCNKVIWEAKE